MTVDKKTSKPKRKIKASTTVKVKQSVGVTLYQKVREGVKKPFLRIKQRVSNLLMRRPHRSFRSTRRRDYVRSLKLPGYWAFTGHVRKTLWQQKKIFFYLVLIYGLLTTMLVGISSQDTYTQLSDVLRSTSGEVFKGNWGEIGKASLLLISGASGTLSPALSEIQQIYATILVLFTWLTTVWLLRGVVAGRKLKLRDGLYNAGAPVLSTFLVGLLLVVQLLPVAIAAVGFGAATTTGLLDSGIEAMIFWTAASLLGALSLYWITSTFIALVVVTLPGMYPMQAIKTAGDLVIGRRLRILLRILWMFLILILLWAVIMIPIILLDTWLKTVFPVVQWLPVVPVALLVMTTLTVIWSSSYVYLLYRKVVDDDAAPA